jgi:hypothetical protein
MANPAGKRILLAVGLVAIAGITYLSVGDRVGPNEGAEGTIGNAARQHQSEKTRYYGEVNQEQKIQDLARIAAKFETAPPEAEQLLRERGWSRADFDRMVEAIRGDEAQNRMFEEAKKLAAQG